MRFKENEDGIYAINMTNKEKIKIENKVSHVNSIADNLKHFSYKQQTQAKRARELYHILGMPLMRYLKNIIKMNLIKNYPVTEEDIDIATKIYGPEIGVLKGKTVRKKYPQVKKDYIELPKELSAENIRYVTLMIDTMSVNGCLFLSTISLDIYYRSAHYVNNKTSQEYEKALEEIFRIYNEAGFKIGNIRADKEFKSVLKFIRNNYKHIYEKNNFTISTVNPQQHVPQADWNVRTIKEKCRSLYHQMPYNHLQKTC